MKRLSAVALFSAAALALTGCGTAHPGAAARIGDETISMNRVDQLSKDMCTALKPRLQQAQQVVPMSYFRTGVVQLLAEQAQAEQIAHQYGVSPGSDYAATVANNAKAASAVPAQYRDDFVEVFSASSLAASIQAAVGAMALEHEGMTNPTSQAAVAKGQQIFQQWAQSHTFEVDPRFGLAQSGGKLVPTDGGVSYAFSPIARAGQMAQANQQNAPDQTYLAELPPSQKCG